MNHVKAWCKLVLVLLLTISLLGCSNRDEPKGPKLVPLQARQAGSGAKPAGSDATPEKRIATH